MIQKLKVILLLFLVTACGQKRAENDVTEKHNIPTKSKPVEIITPTIKQLERRQKSEAICKSKKIPIYSNPNSLFTESDENINLRTQEEVEDRALALLLIGLKSEGLETDILNSIDFEYKISSKLSPKEKLYFYSKDPSEEQKINANWNYESLHVLLWALGFYENLYFPDKLCNAANDIKIIYDLKSSGFKKTAKLRSKKEILDEADLILRFDWECVNARIKGNEPSAGLNKDVVVERHHALNWLINYMNQNWDDISTDT